MREPERLEISADDSLRLLLELMIEVDRVNTLPANGAKVLAWLFLQPDGSADQADVAKKLNLSIDQMGRVADKLHDQRLVRRRESERDRRVYRLSITERGRGEVGKLDEATQSVVLKFATSQLSRKSNSRDAATK